MKPVALFVVVFACFLGIQGQLQCPPLPSRPPPTTIHELHPNDVKVVMTLGDSITAGFGLMGRKGWLDEFRGQSWAIGADPNATTMFNFLKTWNPTLIGGSLGSHIVEICIDPHCPNHQYHPELDVLNAAQSGAMVDDLVPHEMDYLMSMLQGNPNISMENDWKVMTLLIGANDICGACLLSDPSSEPDMYETGVTAVLENVRTNIPKVFVNLVNMFNLSGVYNLSLQSSYCEDVHKDFAGECPCIFDKVNGTEIRTDMDVITQQINARMQAIQEKYQAANYTDFAVIVQPFGRDTNIGDLPFDFISTLDCFHPALLAHQIMATSLWNNMITPMDQKKSVINPKDTPLCPTEDTLLYTY